MLETKHIRQTMARSPLDSQRVKGPVDVKHAGCSEPVDHAHDGLCWLPGWIGLALMQDRITNMSIVKTNIVEHFATAHEIKPACGSTATHLLKLFRQSTALLKTCLPTVSV